MIHKKYKGADLEKILNEIDFSKFKREVEMQVSRQKQRYALNTMLEEYEVVLSLTIKKVRK